MLLQTFQPSSAIVTASTYSLDCDAHAAHLFDPPAGGVIVSIKTNPGGVPSNGYLCSISDANGNASADKKIRFQPGNNHKLAIKGVAGLQDFIDITTPRDVKWFRFEAPSTWREQ